MGLYTMVPILKTFLYLLTMFDNSDKIDGYDKNFIETTLGKLKEIEHKILRLRYYKDYSFSEICDETGIKLNTIFSEKKSF